MLKELFFTLYSFKKNIQSSAELRTTFILNVFGMIINDLAFLFLWLFFVQTVGEVGGWRSIDIVGLLGFSTISYGLANTLANGIDLMVDYVSSGAFDRFMLSPKNLLLRVATSNISTSAVGDIVFGIICLTIYALSIQASWYQTIMVLFMIVIVTVVFISVQIIVNSISFFMVDAESVINGVYQIFLSPSLFHGGAFQGVLRFVFTFIVPSLLIGTLPVEAVKSTSFSGLLLLAVLSMCWLVLAVWIFYRSVKHYESSNFMTFGS